MKTTRAPERRRLSLAMMFLIYTFDLMGLAGVFASLILNQKRFGDRQYAGEVTKSSHWFFICRVPNPPFFLERRSLERCRIVLAEDRFC